MLLAKTKRKNGMRNFFTYISYIKVNKIRDLDLPGNYHKINKLLWLIFPSERDFSFFKEDFQKNYFISCILFQIFLPKALHSGSSGSLSKLSFCNIK